MANLFDNLRMKEQNRNDESRRVRQDRLTAKQAGYDYDEQSGQYKPSENTQMKTEITGEDLKAKLDVIQATQREQESINNAASMKTATTSIIGGNYSDAKKIIKQNPTLKKKLAAGKLNVVDFAPIDFDNDIELLQQTKLPIDGKKLSDPEYRQAINQSLFKVQGKDGEWRISRTNDLVKATNYWKDASTSERDNYTNTANNINSIITKGMGITSGEQAVGEQKTKLTNEYLEKSSAILNNPDLSSDEIIAQTRELYTQYNPTAAKAASASEEKSRFEVGELKETKDIVDYIENDRGGFNTQLELGDKNFKIGGKTLYHLASTYQKNKGNNKPDTLVKEIKGNEVFLNNAVSVKAKMESLDLDRDAWAKLKTEGSKVLGTDFFEKSKEEQNKILNKISVETEIGATLAMLIKEMSGAGVTEGERDLYTELFSAGSWSTKEAMIAALDGIVSPFKTQYDSRISTLKNDSPRSYLDNFDSYDTTSKAYTSAFSAKSEAKSEVVDPTTMSREQKISWLESMKAKAKNMVGMK